MYSKTLYQVLKNLIDFFTTMTNTTNASPPSPYVFKPFRYEEIKPNRKSRVPYPRSGHRIGADSANFYSFGGYNPLIGSDEAISDEIWVQSYPLFQELWRFNFARKEWTRYSNSHTLPLELASNALVLHKNVLMVYGGTGSPFGFRCSNQLFVCRVNDSEGLMDEVHTTGQLPLPAYGQALIYHNDYLYTIGGTTGVQYTCDIHRLNLKTLVWESVYICRGIGEYEPTGRYRHEVGFDKRNIYVLGGGTALLAFDFSTIPVFNLEKQIWYPQKSIRDTRYGVPQPRRCHGAVQITTEFGNQVFIAGGHDGENVFDDLWRLDLQTFQWTYFDKCRLPFPIYFHAAAASPEGRLYIFGGICSSNDNDVRRSNCMYSTWLCIPKLSEICWEAVLHYSPHIVKCRSEDLINIGLPRHFVQRLGNNNPPIKREQ
ncbi:kelch domain-containing protein 10 homolog [Tribolium castaneum]|nr:PREDICTED: kelch domain-containing protein 10 homolog [Tribolium castaneum]|eukprot:XP_968306.2 PREDICTED: kelch domain-containing protein 10 homolog [Tribolium castaneum]